MRFRSCVFLLAVLAAAADEKPVYQGLKWRSIGPYRGGRAIAVAGVPSQRNTFYFGATGGGVWKTTDAGRTWVNVSDGFFKTGTVGAIAVSESDPNVVYAGMGESCVRGNVSHGDGVYRSADGGKTWRHMGLAATRHIGRIRVHPRNPGLVYVAALGHIFGPNDERGVFRSKDGGKSWERILFKSRDTGAVDLAMDPNNPDVLYAAFWQARRKPWSFDSGGPEGGLWKSVDGGDTWTEITRNAGLPKGVVGRIGVAVSPMNSERVWAVIEAEDGGVFRSDDAGKTWRRTNENRNLRQRAWYYTHVYADTQDADRVYVLNVGLWRSDDGGRTFRSLPSPHGDDHDLWISPHDNKTMIIGDDGGASVSMSGGTTWTAQTQATAQFYRVALDGDFPYNVYGAQQDNSTVRIASRTTSFGITDRHWWPVGGGESGWIAPHPKDSNIVFAGSYGGYLTRYDHRTGQTRAINVWPDNPMGYGAEGMKFRFQWNFPILFSPHDPNTLYTAGNLLFKTNTEGQSWQAISGDLTRNDPSKLGPSGGPITKDNTGVEYYSTIFTVAESPKKKGVIWTGSDDGLVHVTQDGGQNWVNVTPKEMPEWIQINSIEASPHDPAAAYFAGTMYKSDDFRPYLYKTADYGKTWTKITAGLPEDSFTRVIREDPARRGLLYAGTETGLWVSFDDGARWETLQMNLPVVPITDLAVHARERDLVAATQGRSFWILDDLTVLHQYMDKREAVKTAAQLFEPEPAYRMAGGRFRAQPGGTAGENPPAGVVLTYSLPEKPKEEVTIEILDAAGKQIRKFSSKQEPRPAAGAGDSGAGEEGPQRGAPAPSAVPVEKGLNQFVWDMRYPDAVSFPGLILWAGSTRGPLAPPGKYEARLAVDGKTLDTAFEIRKDPRVPATQQEFEKQLTLLLQIRDKLSETHEAIIQIRDLRRQINDLADRYKDLPDGKTIGEAAKELVKKLTAVEEELYQTKLQSNQDPLNYPIKLNNKLAALAGIVASADAAPTDQSYQLHEELTSKINAQLRTLQGLVEKDLAGFNKLVRDKNVPAVAPKKPSPRS
jgi:photosystem II stability/assembly factor-like uncharacterized protein